MLLRYILLETVHLVITVIFVYGRAHAGRSFLPLLFMGSGKFPLLYTRF